MALPDQIQSLLTGTLNALDASHDYYTHTRAMWHLTRRSVGQGRKFRVGSSLTGSSVDEQTLMRLSRDYLENHLRPSTFLHFVSVFESFVFDLLRLWLSAYPASLAEKELRFRTVLNAPNLAAVTLVVVDRELNELKYERVADWFAYLERRAKLGCPTAADIDNLTEIKASRDILLHANAVANAIYVAKAGSRAVSRRRTADHPRGLSPR